MHCRPSMHAALRGLCRMMRDSCQSLSDIDLALGCLSVATVKEHSVLQAILFDLDETLTDRTASIEHYAERFQCDFTNHLASTAVSTITAALLTADVRGYRPREDVLRDFAQRLAWRTVPEVSR